MVALTPREREEARRRVFSQITKQVAPGSTFLGASSQKSEPEPESNDSEPDALEQPLVEEQQSYEQLEEQQPSQLQPPHEEALWQAWEVSLKQFLAATKLLVRARLADLTQRARNAPGRWMRRLKQLRAEGRRQSLWAATAPPQAILPPGWTESFDTSTGRTYYVSPDGVSMWTRPEGFPTVIPTVPPPPPTDDELGEAEAAAWAQAARTAAQGQGAPMVERGAEEPARALKGEQGESSDAEGPSSTEAVGPLKMARKEASVVKSAWAANAAKRMRASSSSERNSGGPTNSIVNSTKPLQFGD